MSSEGDKRKSLGSRDEVIPIRGIIDLTVINNDQGVSRIGEILTTNDGMNVHRNELNGHGKELTFIGSDAREDRSDDLIELGTRIGHIGHNMVGVAQYGDIIVAINKVVNDADSE